MKALLLQDIQAFLRYEDLSGGSPAVIYLPGLMMPAHASFASIINELPALGRYRSIMVDLLGSGFSDAPQDFGYSLEDHARLVTRLMDELELKGCNIVGYSMGGAVAITLASIRPDLVSRLVLLEANLDSGGGSLSKSICEQTEQAFCEHGFQDILKSLRMSGLAGNSYAATVAGLVQIIAPHALYRSAAGLVRGTQPTMRERLVQMDIPRTYIFGEMSLPDPDWDELSSHGVHVLMVEHAGHDMLWQNPHGVASALNTALAV